MKILTTEKSPLEAIDTSFSSYVAERLRREQSHMDGGVPDYSFALDYQLRYRLGKIPFFYSLCKKITATIVSRQIQIYNQNSVAVGPNQYPDIYNMGLECAERLGIGVPNIFVHSNPQMNAFTYASDDISPMIVLFTGIIDRMTPGELRCVVAHECGHIHNQHTVYKSVISQILSGKSGLFGIVLSVANVALMQFWTRACEITADRAALICCNNTQDAVNVQKKLLSGGTFNQEFQDDLDIEELREQLETTINNPSRIYEILSNHPSSIRRIFCTQEFEECEIFYKWRSDLKKVGGVERSKEETDYRCQQLINIWDNTSASTFGRGGQSA